MVRGSVSKNWTLDAQGNWSQVETIISGASTTQTRGHNRQNEITSISGQTPPAYDANGNLTTNEEGRTLVYDAWNRLAEVKNGAVSQVVYSYDALGRRVREDRPDPADDRDLYYSAAWQVLEERSGSAIQAQYVWSPVYVDAIVLRDAGGVRLYAQQDANFNVTALLDVGGNVVERYTYDPFGAVTVRAADWSERGVSAHGWIYLHQGGRLDGVVGLYHFRNRDYSASLGRWVQRDPIEFRGGDPNLYRTVGNGVTSRLDPSGLEDNMLFRIPPQPTTGPGLDQVIDRQLMARGRMSAEGRTPPPLMAGSVPAYGSDGNRTAFEAMFQAGRASIDMSKFVLQNMALLGVGGPLAGAGRMAGLAAAGMALADGDVAGAAMGVAPGIVGRAGSGILARVIPCFRRAGRTVTQGRGLAFAGEPQPWTSRSALEAVTGRTARARNRAIQGVIADDLSAVPGVRPGLRLTHTPQYSPYARTGLAMQGEGTQIGKNVFHSRHSLRNTIIHEELHHRWWARGIPTEAHHAARGVYVANERFYRVIERYERMRGWRVLDPNTGQWILR